MGAGRLRDRDRARSSRPPIERGLTANPHSLTPWAHDALALRRFCTRITVTADQGAPVGVSTPRAFSATAIALALRPASFAKAGRNASARARASSRVCRLLSRMAPPRLTPCAFFAARAAFVRWDMSERSFSASAA